MPAATFIALAIIAFAAAFHIHWAFGGKRGFDVSLPQRPDGTPVMSDRLPLWRPAAFGVGLALLGLGLIVIARARAWDIGLPPILIDYGLIGTGTVFVARALVPNRYVGLSKTLRTTRWARWDTRLYSPLFLILGVALIVVACG